MRTAVFLDGTVNNDTDRDRDGSGAEERYAPIRDPVDTPDGDIPDGDVPDDDTSEGIGATAGALVIPPILDLLNQAYGFAGAVRPDGSMPTAPLPAPQATLISALAKGVLGGNLDWSLIGIGTLVGVGFLMIDGVLVEERS